jgi:hypothetical protein
MSDKIEPGKENHVQEIPKNITTSRSFASGVGAWLRGFTDNLLCRVMWCDFLLAVQLVRQDFPNEKSHRLEHPVETTPKQDNQNSADRRNCSVQRPELDRAHLLVEPSDPADEDI